MAKTSTKNEVGESEYSMKIQSANWTEQVILHRNLQLIKRCEKTVTSKITVHQKIMYRAFQRKLEHSRLTHAKIMNNKELEKEIRSKDKFAFNTNVGDIGENNMLSNIWKMTEERAKVKRVRSRPNTVLSFLEESDERKNAETNSGRNTSTRPGTRQRSPQARTLLKQRPKTCPAGLSKRNISPSRSNEKEKAVARKVQYATDEEEEEESIHNESENEDDDEDNCEDGSDTENTTTTKEHKKSTVLPRPKTAAFGGVRPRSTKTTPSPVPRKSALKKHNTGLFVTQTQPTLLDLHKYRIKSANYEKQVQEFCKTIEPYKINPEEDNDENSLLEDLDQIAESENVTPKTTVSEYDDEFKRNLPVGNPKSGRSLTLKAIDWNFNRRPSI